jgi:hypothetical protein
MDNEEPCRPCRSRLFQFQGLENFLHHFQCVHMICGVKSNGTRMLSSGLIRYFLSSGFVSLLVNRSLIIPIRAG